MSLIHNFTTNSYQIRRELVVTKNSLKKAPFKVGMRILWIWSEVGPRPKIFPQNAREI
jgi:hypothetical protein